MSEFLNFNSHFPFIKPISTRLDSKGSKVKPLIFLFFLAPAVSSPIHHQKR